MAAFIEAIFAQKVLLWSWLLMLAGLVIAYEQRLRVSFLNKIDYPTLKNVRVYLWLAFCALLLLTIFWYLKLVTPSFAPVFYPFAFIVLIISLQFRLRIGLLSAIMFLYFIYTYLIAPFIVGETNWDVTMTNAVIAVFLGVIVGTFIRRYQLSLGTAVEELRELNWRTRQRLAKRASGENVLKVVQKASLALESTPVGAHKLYHTILNQCKKIVDAQYICLLLPNDTGQYACAHVETTIKSAKTKELVNKQISQYANRLVNQQKISPTITKPITTSDIKELTAIGKAIDAIIIPMRMLNRFGILVLLRLPPQSPFSEKDKQITSLFVAHAAVALRNSQHHEILGELMRARDQFASAISHELKTPLSTIKLYAQLLEEQPLKPDSTELFQKGFTIIDKEVDKLTSLINMIYDFSKIQSGKFTIEKKRFDLRELSFERIETMSLLHPEHKFNFRSEIEKAPILADRLRLDQVLTNILSNAAKYSPPGSKIDFSLSQKDTIYVVKIRDYGKGIPVDDQQHIFEAFFRSQKTDGGPAGLGLGLYITKGIVDLSGGKISVKSEVGKGSTFTIQLPRS